MSKHTPGPWQMGHASSGRGPNDDGGDYPIYVADNSDYKHILAEVICQTSPLVFQPAEANAKLIAGAPELLEACQQMLWHATMGPDEVGAQQWDEDCTLMAAAIKKATK